MEIRRSEGPLSSHTIRSSYFIGHIKQGMRLVLLPIGMSCSLLRSKYRAFTSRAGEYEIK